MEQFSRKRVIWKEGKRRIKRMNRGNGHLHGWAAKHYEKFGKNGHLNLVSLCNGTVNRATPVTFQM
jgi:hypothetical protein